MFTEPNNAFDSTSSGADPFCASPKRNAAHASSDHILTVRPPIRTRGKDACVFDVDGNEYVDYTAGDGSLILGHSDQGVAAAINKAVSKGCTVGSPSETELYLANVITGLMPAIDDVRFVASSESAITRTLHLARRATGRTHVLTFFESSVLPADRTILAFNDTASVRRCFQEFGREIAAVIVQPIADRFGPVAPDAGFLELLRSSCSDVGAILIFDESTSAFRMDRRALPPLQNVRPDLTILGSVLGGGLPLAAYGGSRDIMQKAGAVDAEYPSNVSLAALAAGITTLESLSDSRAYQLLDDRSARLDQGLRDAAKLAELPSRHARIGSMVGFYPFGEDGYVRTADSAAMNELFAAYYDAMLEHGILISPSPVSCWFVSTAHTEVEIDRTIKSTRDALCSLHALQAV